MPTKTLHGVVFGTDSVVVFGTDSVVVFGTSSVLVFGTLSVDVPALVGDDTVLIFTDVVPKVVVKIGTAVVPSCEFTDNNPIISSNTTNWSNAISVQNMSYIAAFFKLKLLFFQVFEPGHCYGQFTFLLTIIKLTEIIT